MALISVTATVTLSPEAEQLLLNLWNTQAAATTRMESMIMAIKETVDAIRADLAGYVADVTQAMADLAAKEDALIKAAVDADNNLDATELTALWDELKAARASIKPPTPPEIPASNVVT